MRCPGPDLPTQAPVQNHQFCTCYVSSDSSRGPGLIDICKIPWIFSMTASFSRYSASVTHQDVSSWSAVAKLVHTPTKPQAVLTATPTLPGTSRMALPLSQRKKDKYSFKGVIPRRKEAQRVNWEEKKFFFFSIMIPLLLIYTMQ